MVNASGIFNLYIKKDHAFRAVHNFRYFSHFALFKFLKSMVIFYDRNSDIKNSAIAFRTGASDHAAKGLGYNIIYNVHTEPGPPLPPLSGIKWIKYPFNGLLRHAFAVIMVL